MRFLLALLLFSVGAFADEFHVRNSCSNNGNGTASTCAGAPGGAGAWKAISNISGVGAGDIVNFWGTYNPGENFHNVPAGVNGVNGNPVIFQNGAGQDALIDGRADCSGATWTSVGSGVYSSTGCSVTAVAPHHAWYLRAGQSVEEELSLESTTTACNTSLQAGWMRYNQGTGTACVHLSDGSSPASAQYLKMPKWLEILRFNANNNDYIRLRKNPAGGNFRISYAVRYNIQTTSTANTGIEFDGIITEWTADRCINVEGTGLAAAKTVITNSEISHCFQEGVHLADDTQATFTNNWVHHIQYDNGTDPPDYQYCGGTCPLGGMGDKGTGIRTFATHNIVITGNRFEDIGGGLFGTSYAVDLEGSCSDCIVDNNQVFRMVPGPDAGNVSIAYFAQSQGSGPYSFDMRNNRAYLVDVGFTIDCGVACSPTLTLYNNTFAQFRRYGIGAPIIEANISGSATVRNNVLSSTLAATRAFDQPTQWTLIDTVTDNQLYCPSCTGGVFNNRGSTATTGNTVGDPQISLTGVAPTLKPLEGSPLIGSGVNLSATFTTDCNGDTRTVPWDKGACLYIVSGGGGGGGGGGGSSATGGPLSDVLEGRILGHFFQGVAATQPSALYVGLSTATCTEGTFGTEVSGGGYARVQINPSTTNWAGPVSNNGTVANGIVVQFPTATADWGSISHFFIADAATAGNILVCSPLTLAKTIPNGSQPAFPLGSVTVQVDN